MIRQLLIFILLVLLIPSHSCPAAEEAGEVVRLDGTAILYVTGTVRGRKVSAGDRFKVGETIRTKKDSLVYCRFVDGSKAVLKPDSSLAVIAVKHGNVDQGTVLFEIKKQGEAKGLMITSKTVTMGVKGTRFGVISEEEEVAIYLKEGFLEIGSLKGEFKKHYQSLEDEFRQQQEKMRQDFKSATEKMADDYDRTTKEMKSGNYELVKSFTLEGGQAVMIAGNEVRDQDIPPEMEEDFKLLDGF
ncbi:MAG: FecR family protein [Proteobacteria bacterium]|nr:FecR family protein [Pseudomonadota bacterium]MBU1686774.1 FecR family protein [Pseudomonadota bacterium]